ncbi:hypothetical protein KR038_002287, partial [Drosophila bunnanda]
ISIAYFTQLALLALISLQAAPQLLAAPFPGIENALVSRGVPHIRKFQRFTWFLLFFRSRFRAFTSQDLLAEESSPVSSLSQVHVQHNRHRRHHGFGHSHHKRHWDHEFPDPGPGPSCHHHGGFGYEHPHHGPPHHRFEPFPHGFEPFPNTFGPPGHEEHQRPFKAELAPFKDDKERSPLMPSSSSVAPPSAPPVTSPPATTTTSSSTAAPTTTSTEDAPLAIDIRIG